MKKLFMVLLVGLTLSFTACGGNDEKTIESNLNKMESSVSNEEEQNLLEDNNEEESNIMEEQKGDFVTVKFKQPNSLSDFPVNDGDEQYFISPTEDYVLSMRDPNPDDEKEEFSIALACFDEQEKLIAYFDKSICVSEEEAESVMQNCINGGSADANETGYVPDSCIRVGNVVYSYKNVPEEAEEKKADLLNSMNLSEEDLKNVSSVEQIIECGIIGEKDENWKTIWFSIPSFEMEKEVYDEITEYIKDTKE